jgi:hypothetical protein
MELTVQQKRRRDWVGVIAGLLLTVAVAARAQQHRPMEVPGPDQAQVVTGRTRLILKDGTYQQVMSYQVVGDVVRYKSAERAGEMEEIPLALVDLAATQKWAADHGPDAKHDDAVQEEKPPVLSPELQKEEADRAARTPEVAPDLRLPEEMSVLALDTFEGTPELVPLPQDGSSMNKETAHAVDKVVINPASSPHRLLDLAGAKADIQLHVADPVFYVRVGPDDAQATGQVFTVDTSGAKGKATPSSGAAQSGYVIERLDVRHDVRVVDSFRMQTLGTGKQHPDVIEMKHELMPGGHWLKVTPVEPLAFGEYALIEVLDDRNVNLNVWSFGVHPTAVENVEAIRPEPKKPAALERRGRQ